MACLWKYLYNKVNKLEILVHYGKNTDKDAMKTPNDDASASKKRQPRGIAALYDESERKTIFKKYVIFLGWLEVAVFSACWLFHMGNQGYDRYGPVEAPFPWKSYFLIAFLVPVAVTFLLGVIIVGFNKYFGGADAHEEGEADGGAAPEFAGNKSGNVYKLFMMVNLFQKLPFLGLLMLLALAAGFFYRLDDIVNFVGTVGEKSIKIILISLAVIGGVAVVFGLIMLIMNYRLRKRSMEYQYRSEVAERFGLIILEDNTVLNSEGRLLVQGKNMKDTVPLLTVEPADNPTAEGREQEEKPASATLRRPADCGSTS